MKKSKQNAVIALSAAVTVALAIGLVIFINASFGVSGDSGEPEANEISENLRFTTTEPPTTTAPPPITTTPPETTTPPATTTTAATTTPPPATEKDVVETLAPVSTLSQERREVMEENNIDVRQTEATQQTTPPPEAQREPMETTYIDGVKYVWHPIFGWVESGEGSTEIYDTPPSGEYYDFMY
ncbi:MAG: hypothetical protein FWH08_00325 [Oscillospiraceae bacterium]|nr:hypothetical protein [Oscillospiraceae bacterium]